VLDLKAGQAKEVKQQEENGIVNMYREKPKGLGDSIENFTTKTGIKGFVDKVSNGLNIPCGCEGRRKAMNAIFPYKYKD
jgi:hypothetical protein